MRESKRSNQSGKRNQERMELRNPRTSSSNQGQRGDVINQAYTRHRARTRARVIFLVWTFTPECPR